MGGDLKGGGGGVKYKDLDEISCMLEKLDKAVWGEGTKIYTLN